MATTPDYEWTDEMDEISGFADDMPDYEEACRAMVIAGAEWFDEHPGADPDFTEIADVFGIVNSENSDAKELVDTMVDAAKEHGDSPTGAMVHAAVRHVLHIKEDGWDEYVEHMKGRAGNA